MTAGRLIVTAEQMRAAEQSAIDQGTSVELLMERAGTALAEAAYRFAGPLPALVLCGPGNNGGDGYVAARRLAERGVAVRVAALSEPKSQAGQWARAQWTGEVEPLGPATRSAPLLIDALFGTGLKRGLEEAIAEQLFRLAEEALVSVACDVPSGVESDSGAELSEVPTFDLTLTFAALKPAHRLMPAMHKCGRVVLADIGIAALDEWHEIALPTLPAVESDANKYSRGLVSLLSGQMPGAAALAARSAALGGAGTVRLYSDEKVANVPAAVIQGKQWKPEDQKKATLLVGPGLGRDGSARSKLADALATGRPVVIDADALRLVGADEIAALERSAPLLPILTPHHGEFEALFGELAGSKAEQARAASRSCNAVVVYKGPDTIVAEPGGRVAFAPPAPSWLASAGSGDVLAGLAAALLSRSGDAFEAACAAVWLHGRSAEIAGPQMIADDLAAAIPEALALLE